MKRIVPYLLLLALWAPTLGYLIGWRSQELKGAENALKRVDLTRTTLAQGTWQTSINKGAEREHPLRAPLIRCRNQVLYWLYNRSTNFVEVGKEGYLYGSKYYEIYSGRKRQTEAHYEDVATQMRKLQDTLDHYGVKFLSVIAPSKVRFDPGILKSSHARIPLDSMTDYTLLIDAYNTYGVNYLNLSQGLTNQRDTLRALPFSKVGIHWNTYGVYRCLPLWDNYVHEHFGYPLQSFQQAGGFWSDSLILKGDMDLAERMNLIQSPKLNMQFYPKFQRASPSDSLPKILFISDSFFYQLMGTYAMSHISRDWEFWYYNKGFLNKQRRYKIPINFDNRWERLLDFDIVVIMGTETNISRFPYGLTDQVLTDN